MLVLSLVLWTSYCFAVAMSGKSQVWNSALVVLLTSMEMEKLTRFSRKSDMWRFSEIPVRIPRDCRRRLRLLFNGSFMRVLSYEWKNNYRKWTIKIKLQHHQLVQILCAVFLTWWTVDENELHSIRNFPITVYDWSSAPDRWWSLRPPILD